MDTSSRDLTPKALATDFDACRVTVGSVTGSSCIVLISSPDPLGLLASLTGSVWRMGYTMLGDGHRGGPGGGPRGGPGRIPRRGPAGKCGGSGGGGGGGKFP
jgi:hypothetical protein